MSDPYLHWVFSKPHLATGLPLGDLQMALDEAAEAGAHFCETPGRRHAARSWLQRNGFSPQVVELLDNMLETWKNLGSEPFFNFGLSNYLFLEMKYGTSFYIYYL